MWKTLIQVLFSIPVFVVVLILPSIFLIKLDKFFDWFFTY